MPASEASVTGVMEGCDSRCEPGYTSLVRDEGAAQRDAAGLRKGEEWGIVSEASLALRCFVKEFDDCLRDVFSFFGSDSVVVAEEE
jgi:hypothetical protein